MTRGAAWLVLCGLRERQARADDAGRPGDAGAAAALRCAVGLRRRLLALNRERGQSGRAALRTATALHTGSLVAGLIGGSERHEYTVIGDTVNVAARLADVAKQRDHDLVVSAETLDLANKAGETAVAKFRETVTLRGRREPIEVVGID